MRRDVRAVQEGYTLHIWRDLLEYLQPFSTNGRLEILEAGDISAGTGQILNEASADRIGNRDKNGRNCLRCVSDYHGRRIGPNDNNVRRECDQLLSTLAYALGHLARVTVVKPDIAAFIPAKSVKTSLKRRQKLSRQRDLIIREGYQQGTPPHARSLLRVTCEWPGNCNTAEKRDELASSHRRLRG